LRQSGQHGVEIGQRFQPIGFRGFDLVELANQVGGNICLAGCTFDAGFLGFDKIASSTSNTL
jgi:hypothetical protein